MTDEEKQKWCIFLYRIRTIYWELINIYRKENMLNGFPYGDIIELLNQELEKMLHGGFLRKDMDNWMDQLNDGFIPWR